MRKPESIIYIESIANYFLIDAGRDQENRRIYNCNVGLRKTYRWYVHMFRVNNNQSQIRSRYWFNSVCSREVWTRWTRFCGEQRNCTDNDRITFRSRPFTFCDTAKANTRAILIAPAVSANNNLMAKACITKRVTQIVLAGSIDFYAASSWHVCNFWCS